MGMALLPQIPIAYRLSPPYCLCPIPYSLRYQYLDIRQQPLHVVDCLGVERPMQRTDLLQGTLDLLILKTLRPGPLHGWGISKRIRHVSDEVLHVNQGSLYPALYRLEDQGWIVAEWGVSDEGRRAKFYQLTAAGRKRLTEETTTWRMFARAVEQILAAG